MPDFSALPLWANLAVFLGCGLVIAVAGVRIVGLGDRLADRTGLGEAVVGAVLLGGTTSLAGSVLSIVATVDGNTGIAISNCLGGIAGQTAFLGIADLTYRRANLEHAAASQANLSQGVLLVALLTLPLMAYALPDWTLWHVSPATLVLLGGYVFGLQLVRDAHTAPMWLPQQTEETREDVPVPENREASLPGLLGRFTLYAAALAGAGYLLSQSAPALMRQSGLSDTLVGGVFTALTTSLPEFIVVIAAVRQGALTLAIGNIIGGNCFDVLFLAFSDVAYTGGSLYTLLSESHLYLIALNILMTGILLLGLLRRVKRGIAGIGFESVLVLLLYIGSFALLAVLGSA